MKITTTNGYNIFRLSPIDYVDKMGSDLAVCDAARVSFDKAASNYT